jgi:tetratricopeptide (TPR) repeat protein
MTGTYPSFHGVRDNSGFVLPPEQVTLAEVLKKGGYSTAAFVGAFVLDSKFGLNQGFDYYYDNFDLTRFENVSPGYIQRTGDLVVKEAVRWLQANRRKPFFVWVHLYDPHDPYTPPQPYLSRHPGLPYDGEVEFSDANVGTLVGWMKKNGAYDDTLVAVVGDHGESFGEHQEEKHGFFIYNATLHVPMIVRFPGGAHGGKTIPQNVGTVDLMPTLAQILQIEKSQLPSVQGSGLLSLMLGKNPNYRADLYAECYYPRFQFGWSQLRAIISSAHKYILAPQPELYDLSKDFGESRNMAAENGVLANRLRDNLRALMARSAPASASRAQSNLDAQTIEKLRSLGYVSLSMGKNGAEDYQSLPDPKDQIGNYNEIVALFELASRGEYDKVIPRYREIVQTQPNLKLVHYKLGEAYFHNGDYPAAVEQFKRAIELGGEDALATFDLAQAYLKMNRIDDAVLGFQRTVQMDPSHYRAHTNLGVLYKNQGKIREAISEFERALEVVPNSVFALGNLGVAYSMAGQPEKGAQILKRAIQLSPENALLYANLGLVYQRLGQAAEAEKQFEIARRLNPRLFKK